MAHAGHMIDELVGTQVIGAPLVGAVGVIEDQQIELELVAVKTLPRFLRQRRRISTVKDAASLCLDGVEQRVHCRVMVGREGCDPVAAGGEGLQRFDLVQFQVQVLAHLGVKKTGRRTIPFEALRGLSH